MHLLRIDELRRGTKGLDKIDQVDPEELENNGVKDMTAEHTQFLSDVEIVKSIIVNNIQTTTNDINENKQLYFMATTAQKEKEVTKHINELIGKTNKKALLAKNVLKRLQEDNARLATPAESKDVSKNQLRIRENCFKVVTKKFVDVMKDYQLSQTTFNHAIKQKATRHILSVNPTASPADIDAVLKSGQSTEDLMKATILKGDASTAIRNAYQNTADKYQDILKLEASVAELNQMFMDFALLTEQQGIMLDSIEAQVLNSAEHIDDGNKAVRDGIKYLMQIRQKQCCIITMIVVALGVVGLIVGLKYGLST